MKPNFFESLKGWWYKPENYISEKGISKRTIVLQKNYFGKLKFLERLPRPSLPPLPTFPKPPQFEEIPPFTQSKG